MLDYDLTQRGELGLYEYLYRCVRDDIASGAIGPDERLPSKRALAAHLGVSLATVEAAYAQLVAEGYVRTRPRSGHFACRLPGRPAGVELVGAGETGDGASGHDGAGETDDWSAASDDRGAAGASRPSGTGGPDARAGQADPDAPLAKKPLLADLTGRSAATDPAAARLWSRTLRAVLATEPDDQTFARPDPAGTPRLRAAIARYLRQTRGMVVDPGRIVVGAGAQLLDGMLVQLVGRGRPVALEDPGYPRLTRLYQANGCEVRHVGLDDEGVRMHDLEASGAGLVHVMPSHQFPTGRVTSIARRYELLGWAAGGTGAGTSGGPGAGCANGPGAGPARLIVEDDYDCEFRLAGRPVPALASVDACGCVAYTNTLSKGLGPAFRLAYLVLPDALAERFGRELGFYDSTVSAVEQAVLARLLETGDYERHVARVRTAARETRDLLVGELLASGAGPRLAVEEADSGLHFVLAAECDRTEREAAATARELGVIVMPLGDFAELPQHRSRPDGRRRFVIQYAGLDRARIPEVAQALAHALS